jgi:hypothetical protein
MSIDTALATVSAATAGFSLLATATRLWAYRQEERVAVQLKEEERPNLEVESGPRDFNEYLFEKAGTLSIREYAADPDVRGVVESAIAQIDQLLEPLPQDPAGPAHAGQLIAAEKALASNDVVGALASLRLGIELELRQISDLFDAPGKRMTPTRTLATLRKLQVIGPDEAEALAHCIRLANGALHGEPVSANEVRDAIASAWEAMSEIHAHISSAVLEGSPGAYRETYRAPPGS